MTNGFLFNDPTEIGDSIGDCMIFCLRKTNSLWKNYIFPSLVVIKDTIKPFFENPVLNDFENDFVNSVTNLRKKE